MSTSYLAFFNNQENFKEIYFLETLEELPEDDVPMVNLPENIKITIILALIIAIIVGSCFKCVLFKGIFSKNSPNHGWMDRPINVLIFVSALIHSITSILTSIHLILILWIDEPLLALFGPFYCFLLPVVGEIGIFYQAIGSFGICIYRMMYIKLNNFVKYQIGEKNLLWIILIFSLSVNSLITFLHMTEESSLRIAKNTCNHKSPEAAQILIDYQISSGEITMPTNMRQKLALIMIMSFQISEFIIYVYFFIWQHKHNNGNIALLMDPNDVRQRNSTNVITFIGQFYGFLIEGSFIAIFLLLTVISNLDISPNVNNFVRSLAVIAHFVNYGALSAVEVLTSSSLRSMM